MAKESMIQREKKRDKLTKKYFEKRLLLKQELKSATTYTAKAEILNKLQRLQRNSSPSRSRNRCWVTGRSRGF